MAYLVMACTVMGYLVMAYTVAACIVMSYIVMAYIVMAHVVMAYIIMCRCLRGDMCADMHVDMHAGMRVDMLSTELNPCDRHVVGDAGIHVLKIGRLAGRGADGRCRLWSAASGA